MPTREALVEDHFLVRGMIVAVLPVGATWPTSSERGMNLEFWVGSDMAFPMHFAAFETICPMNGPCRAGIGLKPSAESRHTVDEITRLIESNPRAELRLRPAVSFTP